MQLEKYKGQSEFVQCCLRDELAVSLRAAESYADNYTAWSHRTWLVERFMHDRKKVALGQEISNLTLYPLRLTAVFFPKSVKFNTDFLPVYNIPFKATG